MFVVTPELEESIENFKEMFELMKDPRNIGEGLAILFCFIVIYFGSILLADTVLPTLGY